MQIPRRERSSFAIEELEICEALAQAIEAKPAYADQAKAEIRDILATGNGVRPKNPRKRGFSNISVTNVRGKMVLEAPITLTRGCRLISGKLILQNTRLPKVLLSGSIGRNARELVDHPCLEHFTVRKGSGNSKDSWFLLERRYVPLSFIFLKTRQGTEP